jgi:hypothetical protein
MTLPIIGINTNNSNNMVNHNNKQPNNEVVKKVAGAAGTWLSDTKVDILKNGDTGVFGRMALIFEGEKKILDPKTDILLAMDIKDALTADEGGKFNDTVEKAFKLKGIIGTSSLLKEFRKDLNLQMPYSDIVFFLQNQKQTDEINNVLGELAALGVSLAIEVCNGGNPFGLEKEHVRKISIPKNDDSEIASSQTPSKEVVKLGATGANPKKFDAWKGESEKFYKHINKVNNAPLNINAFVVRSCVIMPPINGYN